MKIEGRNAVLELLKTDKTIDKILIMNGMRDNESRAVVNAIRNKGCKFQYVEKAIMDKETETRRHQGFIAFVSDYVYADFADGIPTFDFTPISSGVYTFTYTYSDNINSSSTSVNVNCVASNEYRIIDEPFVNRAYVLGATYQAPVLEIYKFAQDIELIPATPYVSYDNGATWTKINNTFKVGYNGSTAIAGVTSAMFKFELEGSGLDPADVFSCELENLQNTEYSMNLMTICCLSETWEQDLYNYLKEKGLVTVYSNNYRATKRLFEQTYPTCAISNYPEIEEMRALVNAIKHGEGNSLTNIRRLTADAILADSNLGEIDESGTIIKRKQIEFDQGTLTSKTLNVDGKLQTYSEAIIRFWQDVFAVERSRSSSPTFE